MAAQRKFSQISQSLLNPGPTDLLVGVTGNAVDTLWSLQQVGSQVLGFVGTLIFGTRTEAEAETIPSAASVSAVMTSGLATAGDGGGSLYVRTGGSTPAGFQSADGQWWRVATPSIALEVFGAVGDGVADDAGAVITALTYSSNTGVKIVGRKGATYFMNSRVFMNGLNIDFDGDGCTFKPGPGISQTFFDFVSFGSGSANLGATATAGDRTITVAGLSGTLTVGYLLVFNIFWGAGSRAGMQAVHVTKITNVAGAIVSMADAIPAGLTMTFGVDTVTVSSIFGMPNFSFKNAKFDGSALAADVGCLTLEFMDGGVLEDITVDPWLSGANANTFALNVFDCYQMSIRNITANNTGGHGSSSINISGSGCNYSNIISRFTDGQGPIVGGTCNNVSNVQVVHSINSRNGGIQACHCCNINNWYSSGAEFVGFKVAFNASHNNISNLTITGTGTGFPTNEQGLWFSGNQDSYNNFTNFIIQGTVGSPEKDIQLFPTDDHNTFNGGYVRDWAHISDSGTGNTFRNVNGIDRGSMLVGDLPLAADAGNGARAFVTNATATTFASVVAGGGGNAVPVYCDGANWRIG